MRDKLSVLESLVEQDFGLVLSGERWATGIEHDSLVIDREKQIFFWNSKDISGDAYVYLTEVRHWSHNDAKDYLREGRASTTFIHEIKDRSEYIVYPKLVEIFHENLLKGDKSYFYKRTINDETIARFKLGYYDGFYMIPIYQDGLLRQFQKRQDEPVKKIRGYYKDAGAFLYNSDILTHTKSIFIVEGLTSCLVLAQNEINTVSYTSGAEGFMQHWYPYFMYQKDITLLYDNDEAGRKGALHTASILGENRCKIYTFGDFSEEGYDANDFFKEGGTAREFLDLVSAKSKYSFELGRKRNGKRLDKSTH